MSETLEQIAAAWTDTVQAYANGRSTVGALMKAGSDMADALRAAQEAGRADLMEAREQQAHLRSANLTLLRKLDAEYVRGLEAGRAEAEAQRETIDRDGYKRGYQDCQAEVEARHDRLAQQIKDRIELARVAEARIAELEAERYAYKRDFEGELAGNEVLRQRFGAKDSETMHAFLERLASEAKLGSTEAPITPPMAAGLLMTLKEECEVQHARAEAAESRIAELEAELAQQVDRAEAAEAAWWALGNAKGHTAIEEFSGVEPYYQRLFKLIVERHNPPGTGGDTECLIAMVRWLWKQVQGSADCRHTDSRCVVASRSGDREMSDKQIPPNAICKHCGQKSKDHRLANYADGPLIGAAFIVCPTAVFKQKQLRAAPEREP